MGMAAVAGTALSIWSALRWDPVRFDWSGFAGMLGLPGAWSWLSPEWLNPSWIAAALFAIPAALLLFLASRPAIEIYDTHLRIGRREIRWREIRRVDRTRWEVPLVAHLTLEDGRRLLLIHPGDSGSAASVLRYLRRSARAALLDGIPYQQFWGEPPAAPPPRPAPLRYPLLRPEDEAEVERMFQRLKSVGRTELRDADEE